MDFKLTKSLASSSTWGRRFPAHPLSPLWPRYLRNHWMRILCLTLIALFFCLGSLLHPLSVEQDIFVPDPWDSVTDDQFTDEQTSEAPFSSQSRNRPFGRTSKPTHRLDCSIDNKHLSVIQRSNGLEDKLRYLKRYIRFHRTPGLERKGMTRLSQPFLSSGFKTVDVRKKYSSNKCDAPLDVEVTMSEPPSTVNASMFMFGISTTYARLMNEQISPLKEWKFWLTDGQGASNGAKLLLMLHDANDKQLQEVANLLGDAGVDADVHRSPFSVEMAVRYLNLIPVLYNHIDAKSRSWLVLCDDDTFFPVMHSLVRRFKTFDSTVPAYIGTLSEDVFSVERHGSQAFGGAGIFLSLPMAKIVNGLYGQCTSRNKVRESNTGWGPQGDVLLRKCIYENTDVRLKTLWDLWQLDIVGDASGFYEWGTQPLSLHHYRGGDWTHASPAEFTKIAHICGEDCILQRFMTQDGFVISGHSVAYYPEGTDFDWDMLERTMDAMPEDKGWNLDFMFGPQRPSLSRTGKKIAWDLHKSNVMADGSVLQTYTRRWDDWRWMYPDDSPINSLDSVLELVWIPV